MTTELPPFISKDELRRVFALSERALERLLASTDAPPAVMLGGQMLFRVDRVEEWIDAHVVHTSSSN